MNQKFSLLNYPSFVSRALMADTPRHMIILRPAMPSQVDRLLTTLTGHCDSQPIGSPRIFVFSKGAQLPGGGLHPFRITNTET